EIFYQPEFDPGADGESGAVVGDDLIRNASDAARGKDVLSVSDVHPGAASLGVEQPIVRSITHPSGHSGKPLSLRREPLLRKGSTCRTDQGVSADRRIGP